jgi:DNA polymerase/3'-5' exonuclease PolX
VATIRGDAGEHALLITARSLVGAHQVSSDAALGPLLEHPPAGTDPGVLRRLQHMYSAGSWVLIESAIADLPADLRWLYESGAVTLEQLAAIHQALGTTSAGDLAAVIEQRLLRSVPGCDEAIERAVAEALPELRARIPRIPLGRAMSVA